jgi:sporulation protein YlmC with PRC-barrel domain
MAMHELDLVRDVLDKQIVDEDDNEMGRVDGIAVEIRNGEPPRVDHLELGFSVLAERLHPRLEGWLRKIRDRWSVRRSGRYSIPWERVEEVNVHHVKAKVKADQTPAFDWERWLRKNVVKKIPGGEEK